LKEENLEAQKQLEEQQKRLIAQVITLNCIHLINSIEGRGHCQKRPEGAKRGQRQAGREEASRRSIAKGQANPTTSLAAATTSSTAATAGPQTTGSTTAEARAAEKAIQSASGKCEHHVG